MVPLVSDLFWYFTLEKLTIKPFVIMDQGDSLKRNNECTCPDRRQEAVDETSFNKEGHCECHEWTRQSVCVCVCLSVWLSVGLNLLFTLWSE